MKNRFFYLACMLLIQVAAKAQMKIGDNPTTINSASLLELETTNKGLVLPRLSLTSVSSSSPLPAGLLTGTVVFNTNAAVTGGNGIGLYVWGGSAWAPVTSNVSSSAWSLTGNAGTSYLSNFIGTTDNVGFRVRTNNIQRMMVDSLGDIAIGSETFDPVNRERLLVDYGATTTTSHTVANFRGNIDGYLQINLQNISNGVNASSDYIATADDGTESTFYVDMGINSSAYAPGVENWGGRHDAYLYSNSRNLLLGTQANPSDVIFLIGGGKIKENAAMRITGPSGNIVVGNGELTDVPTGNTIRGPNGSGTNIAGGSLTLNGGAGTGAGAGGNLNLYGGSSVSGASGAVNIRANPLSITGVQATSTFTTDSILTIFNGVVKKAPYASLPGGGSAWTITGNGGTNATNNFIGTTNAVDFVVRTNNTERLRILGVANGSSQAGWIGMGIAVPRSPVDMAGNFTNKNILTIQNTSITGYSSVDLFDNSGALAGTFGYANSGTTNPSFADKDYFSIYTKDFLIASNVSTNNFFIQGSSTGNVGINTNTPDAKLDVEGTVKLGTTGSILNNIIKTNVILNPTGISTTGTIVSTVAIAGANTNSTVFVSPRADLPVGVAIAFAYISPAGTLRVGFINNSGATVDPASATYDVTVIQ